MRRLQELIQGAQSGDPAALGEIISLASPLINRCAYEAAPGDRSDLRQQLILQLIELVRRYDATSRQDLQNLGLAVLEIPEPQALKPWSKKAESVYGGSEM